MRRVAWLASLAVVAGCSFGADEYRFVGVTGGSGGAASGAAGVAGGAGLGGAGTGGAGTGGGGPAGAAGKPFCAKGALDCNGKQELVCAADQTKFEPSRKCGPSSTCVPATGCVLPVEVVAGVETSCARFSDGTVQCWGQNDVGQLGIGSVGGKQPSPNKVVHPNGKGPLVSVTSLAVGWKSACAVSDGDVYCWGNDDIGQLGNGAGATPSDGKPSKAIFPAKVEFVSGSLLSFCAVASGGTVSCWGSNNAKFVPGTALIVDTPQAVGGLEPSDRVYVGASTVCARATGGTTSCWGINLRGEAASGMTDSMFHTPSVVRIGPGDTALTSVFGIAVGGSLHLGTTLYSHILLIQGSGQTNGKLSCWGWNEKGQCLVSGGTASLTTPQAVSAVSPIQVSAGGTHSCATFKSTPTAPNVQCWGWNESGQIGNGLKVASAVKAPFTVPGVVNATVSAGANHTCAIGGEARDTIWCWGDNTFGQIGDGGFDPQPSPKVVQIP